MVKVSIRKPSPHKLVWCWTLNVIWAKSTASWYFRLGSAFHGIIKKVWKLNLVDFINRLVGSAAAGVDLGQRCLNPKYSQNKHEKLLYFYWIKQIIEERQAKSFRTLLIWGFLDIQWIKCSINFTLVWAYQKVSPQIFVFFLKLLRCSRVWRSSCGPAHHQKILLNTTSVASESQICFPSMFQGRYS